MKIEAFKTEKQGNVVKVSAEIIWEERDRAKQEIFIETTQEFAEDIFCNPHAFLLAAIIPAMFYGEKRVFIDASICPKLLESLTTAMSWLNYWYGKKTQIIPIEAKVQPTPYSFSSFRRAGLFFSGGIDALAALKTNQLTFPREHPGSIKDGLLVYGVLGGQNRPDQSFELVKNAVLKMAKYAGINLIPVTTNIYSHLNDLDRDFWFWKLHFHGSFFAAIAHAFAHRFHTVSIASTYDLINLEPWGSHPMLDPNYSSYDLQIRHENITLSRLSKTKLVSDWEVIYQNLWVCNEISSYKNNQLNCGQCEKCVRTMTALLALGILDKTQVFPNTDVSEELLIKAAKITDSYEESCYAELIEPLSLRGREDLVRGIKRIIARYHQTDIQGMIKRVDRQFFQGNLVNLVKKSNYLIKK
ncbi:MAG: hypothetical protein Kow0049_16050 [Stanieria sp.]